MELIDKKELSKIAKPELKKFVKEIVYDISEKTLLFTQMFYEDYTPHKYQRIYSLYSLAGVDTSVRWSEQGYIITFVFSSDRLVGNTERKFNGPFVLGYHGGPRKQKDGGYIAAPRMQPSTWDYIFKYAQSLYGAREV